MRHILLDCGEGTAFQLVRLVGRAQASAIIAQLDFVWLSHAHADHHLGLLEVARDFFRITGQALKVFSPTKLHTMFIRKSDTGNTGNGEGETDAAPWLPLIASWEGVPIEVTSCCELAGSASEGASGAAHSATAIRKHVPNCELLGVVAARVAHRLAKVICEQFLSRAVCFASQSPFSCYDAWAIKCTMPDHTNVVYR
jgi:ribonuclease BN (tRNA processing enzyme)